MENFGGPLVNERRPHHRWLSIPHRGERFSRLTPYVAAIIVFAFAQGCFNAPNPQIAETPYAGPAEYASYGYADDPLATYNPFLYGSYCPLPYYYYSSYRGDGDRDCDDGFCGPHGGRKPPHLPLIARSSASAVRLRNNTDAAQPIGATAPSSEPARSLGFVHSSGDSYRGAGVPSARFSAGGFHSGGFGAAGFHGSSHR